jgi:hypothetical protein
MLQTLWLTFINALRENGGRAIPAQWVEEWGKRYNKAVSVKVLTIDNLFHSRFGEHGILF